MSARAALLTEAAALASDARAHIDNVRKANVASVTWIHGLALIRQLEAFRVTLIALQEPEESPFGEPCHPDPVWARLELFGHTVVYGLVGEVTFGGRTFLEVTIPAIWKNDELRDGDPDFPEESKRYHPNAVYAFQEQPMDDVMDALRRQRGIWPRPEYVPAVPYDEHEDRPF